MRQQVGSGLLLLLGLGVGTVGSFSCVGGGWIFVAGLFWGLNKFTSPLWMSFKLGLCLGFVIAVVAMMVMAGAGMISH